MPHTTNPAQDASAPDVKFGAVAIQQALRHHFKLTLRRGAAIAMVAHKNFCSHVYAKAGSNVRPWANRTAEVQQAAISAAKRLMDQAA